jgi:hypothetical protein
MEILNNEENNSIIAWLPEGTGFMIAKKKAFADEVLPKYWKACKFTSFTRKLNRWGFSRVPRGPQTGSYFHKLFQRDKPELCLQMASHTGQRFQASTQTQQLLPSIPPMGNSGGPAYGMQPMFGFVPPPPQMFANMTEQQQQAMFQQSMFHFQQMMNVQQQHMQMAMHNNTSGDTSGNTAGTAVSSSGMPPSMQVATTSSVPPPSDHQNTHNV